MFKLTLKIDDYDDDFCLVRDGAYVPEGAPINYFGNTVAECYENFARTTWVGHRCCLDRGADLGPGYRHVTHFRELFERDLRELLVNSKRVGYFEDWFFFDDVRSPEGIRKIIERGDFASHHGGNQEFDIYVSKLRADVSSYSGVVTAVKEALSAREAVIREYDKTVLLPLLQSLREAAFVNMTGNKYIKVADFIADTIDGLD